MGKSRGNPRERCMSVIVSRFKESQFQQEVKLVNLVKLHILTTTTTNNSTFTDISVKEPSK